MKSQICLCFCWEIWIYLLKHGFVASGLFCFTYSSRRDVPRGLCQALDQAVYFQWTSSQERKWPIRTEHKKWKRERKKGAIKEQVHARPHCPPFALPVNFLMLLLLLQMLWYYWAWSFWLLDGVFRCNEPVENQSWLKPLGDIESLENITLTQEWLTAQSPANQSPCYSDVV